MSTLSQLPMTILDLKGIKDDKFNELVNKEVVGNEKIESLSKILIRKINQTTNKNFWILGLKCILKSRKIKKLRMI